MQEMAMLNKGFMEEGQHEMTLKLSCVTQLKKKKKLFGTQGKHMKRLKRSKVNDTGEIGSLIQIIFHQKESNYMILSRRVSW